MKPNISLRHPGMALFAAVGFVSCGVASFSSASSAETTVEDPTPEQIAFFETKIRPVLAKNCFSCHGPTSQNAGLRVDTIDWTLKGGALVKGDPEKSTLIHAVRYAGPIKMPPAGKLKPTEIADLEAWVKMGAPWPKASQPTKQEAPLWSLQKVKKLPVPKVKNAALVKNPIDMFVLAKLEAKGFSLAAPADRRTLIRRTTFDLIGLPPTAAEVQAFAADKSPNAYEKVVDRLLASPRYGERWARQWLDVARYADTKGYVFEEDRNYANAYTYREWVIKALNSDLPYDQFVTQQLAADRLPEVQKGDDKTALAALGFLTIGRRFLNSTPDIIDDRIDVTMRGFQGFTVACARCHDHKFDPIPTQDYYSLYGIFDSSEERTIPISRKEIREPWERHNAQLAAAEGAKRELVVAQTKRLRSLTDLPEPVKATLQGIREETVPEGGNLDKLSPSFEPAARDRLSALQKEIKGLRDNPPTSPEFAMAMNDRGDAHDGVVFKRGNPGVHGEPAPRRFLLALSDKAEREHWKEGSGRLQLAKAIASKDNPLTARVFVNRVWLGHFGAGLVRTPSDFGRQGEKPTHPELLDYLAATFMENGWSIKRLHRMLVTSATYRQSSDAPSKLLTADPDNRLWGRMNRRRLDLEQMRDTLTAATGRLDLKQVGGKSIDLWSRPFTPRRAVYGFIERQNLPGIFRTFDFASPDSTSPRRFQTTVPQQALFFLNSPFSVEAAQAVAARSEVAGATEDGQRLRRLYLLLFGRLPDVDETAAGLTYLKQGQPSAVGSNWKYGYGEFAAGKTTFTPFANYVDKTYRYAPTIPVPEFGYLNLNQGGGHPGPKSGAIRRWVAPTAMTVAIRGVVQHPNAQGDGVRARIVSSRRGLLGEWTVHNGEAKAEIASVNVQKGETIDFIVDPIGNDAFDSFSWAPTVQGPKETWDAAANFGPPPPAPLSRLTLYAQALMMTNEFMFVD